MFALVHSEFYGGYYPTSGTFQIQASPNCDIDYPDRNIVTSGNINPFYCTYAAVDEAEMASGSASFSLLGSAIPGQVVARPSFAYDPTVVGPTGYFTNTNILQNSDGYFYAMAVDDLKDGSQRRCPIRSNNLSSPASWKGWSGTGFTVTIAQGGDCTDANGLSGVFPFYLGYSTYFGKVIMVGTACSTASSCDQPMLVYALSTDFVHWTQPVSTGVRAFVLGTGNGWFGNNYPSLLDPGALQTQQPNWSTGAIVGQGPWLVFVQTCYQSANVPCSPTRTRVAAVPLAFSN